jgi:hypothetical protein
MGSANSTLADEQSLFQALCRVHSTIRDTDGPEVAIEVFVREATRTAAGADDDATHPADPARPLPAGTPPSAPPAASAGRDAVVEALLQTLGEYRALLNRYSRDFDEAFARRTRDEPEDDDETIRRLCGAQRLLIKYPVAGQAIFSALVREGRRYAKTTDGAAWMARLAGSPALAKARTLFEGLAGGLVGEGSGPLPSTYVDEFVRALDRPLESLLAEVAGAERAP